MSDSPLRFARERAADPTVAPRRRALLTASAGLLTLVAAGASAQPTALPSAIALVVGFPPGGPNDLIARLLAPILASHLQVPVVVENRAGADGELAASAVARGPGNIGMLLFGSAGALTISPAIKKDLPYAPLRDFAPVAQVAGSPMVLVVGSASPYRAAADLIEAARQGPGSLTYASAGTGSPTHLAGALFCQLAGIEMLHVPYRGGGPALTDLVGGHVQLYFAGVSTALPYIQSGKLRALGVTGAAALAALPDVPPLARTPQLPGYEIDNWYGLLASARTPPEQVRWVADAADAAMQDPTLRQKMAVLGIEPALRREQAFAELIRRELAKWQQLAGAIRIT